MKKFFTRSGALILFLIFNLLANSQTGTVEGIVTDKKSGDPLPGANVIIKGTTNGSTTDVNGNYRIDKIPAGKVILEVTYIGYNNETREVTVIQGKSQKVNFLITEENVQLDELVVVGYGTQRKRNLTGSISKLTTEELTKMPVPSFEAGLQGKTTGVQIIQSNGMAGAGSAIRVRGIGSISAGGDPLIVVDGMPVTQDNFGERRGANTNALATINPSDIESVEVLKDASAAAIYGSRGANGVILITTKRGKSKKPVFDFSYKTWTSQETKRLDLLNNKEWLQLYQEAYENDCLLTGDMSAGPRPVLPGGVTWEQADTTNTDWQDKMMRVGISHEMNLSYNQSGKKLNRYVGLNYSNQESYLVGNNYERLSGRLNLDYNPISNLQAGISTMFSRGLNNRVDASWSGGLGSAQSEALPIWPVYNADGTYFTGGTNPVRNRDHKVIRTLELRTLVNGYLQYNLSEALNIRAEVGADYLDQDENYYEDSILRSPTYGESKRTYILAWNSKAYATYNFNFDRIHDFQLMAGTELNKTDKSSKKYWYNGIDKPVYLDPLIPENPSDYGVNVYADEIYSFISYFSRLNYSYSGKYIFSGSIRSDGSSRFGKNKRYGIFPAGSFGWIISEEEFLKDNQYLNFLKVKTSYGVTGNAEIPNYTQYGTTSDYSNGIIYNGDSILYQINLENPNVGWETTHSYDVGFEFGLFNDRISGEFSYYNKTTKGLLLEVKVPTSSGYGQIWKNVGKLENKGIEFSFISRNLVGKFKWTTDFNIGFNKNKVLDTGTAPPDALAGSGDTRVIEGESIGVNYLVRFSHVDPADGKPVFIDINGNLTKEYNVDDRVVCGKPYPDFIGGITNTFSYANFDFSFLFNFSYGNQIYDDAGKRLVGRISSWNQWENVLNRWREPGDVTDVPRLTLDGSKSGIVTDRNTDEFLYDGSFIRLRNISFGYTIPQSVTSRWKIQNMRIYFIGTNVLTFTNYPGLDPEVFRDMENVQQKNLSPSVTYLTPPQAKTYSFGINITF